MKNKNVVVLVSTYNGADFLEKQIESILNQTYPNVDILIRDDGSKDETVDLIKSIQEKTNKVKLIIGENVGYIKSFFLLLQAAQGYDYYALCDQDDIWMKDKIEAALKMLEQEETGKPLLYGNCSKMVDNQMMELGLTQQQRRCICFRNTIIQNILPGHSQVMNQALHQYFKRDLDYTKIYVHDSWITNVAAIHGKIIFDNCPHTYYRQHNNNQIGFGSGVFGWIKERLKRISNNDNYKYAIQIKYIYDEYKSDLNKSDLLELERFLESGNSLPKRIKYALTTKFYRQKRFETLLFRLLYLNKGYCIKE